MRPVIKVQEPRKVDSNVPNTQMAVFQDSMKILFIAGRCLGLNPVEGILTSDVSKIRFSYMNWRFFHCLFIGLAQSFGTILSIYQLLRTSLSIGGLGHCFFYLSTSIDTFLFIHLSTKWPGLMTELGNVSLNKYTDANLKFKCYTICVIMLLLSIVEHVLAMVSSIANIMDCFTDADIYDELLKINFSWYYDSGLPVYKPIAVLIHIINIHSTLIWNYCDIYIICMSLYLASILKKINKEITLASEKRYLPSAYWKSLREAYSRATRLVRSFDDVISGVVFASFTCNLFIICQQIYNIVANGFKASNPSKNICPYYSDGSFHGRVYPTYLLFSAVFLLTRALAVTLAAAGINSASVAPALSLYNVPSSSYCSEVGRFIDQIHSDTVALSGLQFFYVTRELVLSVAGTIVTYELVVLQVSGDGIHSDMKDYE